MKHPIRTYGDSDTLTVMSNVPGLTVDFFRVSEDPGWYLSRCFVAERFRRQGYGKRMVLEGLARLAALGAKWVYVTPGGYNMDHDVQIAFYRSCGFAENPEEPGCMVFTFP